MVPHTFLEPRDDPAFLAVVDRLIAALVHRDSPEDVYLVHMDNWFDQKWLRFSGIGVVAFPGGYPLILTAKDEHSQDQLTFPPFTPTRVVAQYLFSRMPDGTYEERPAVHLIHGRKRERSAKNLHRRVADFSRSALFVWYSSETATNDKASLMVYGVRDSALAAWYAGFSERHGWQLDRVKGTDRKTVLSLVGDAMTKPNVAEQSDEREPE